MPATDDSTMTQEQSDAYYRALDPAMRTQRASAVRSSASFMSWAFSNLGASEQETRVRVSQFVRETNQQKLALKAALDRYESEGGKVAKIDRDWASIHCSCITGSALTDRRTP